MFRNNGSLRLGTLQVVAAGLHCRLTISNNLLSVTPTLEAMMCEGKSERVAPLLRLLAEAVDARNESGQIHRGALLLELGRLARLQIPTHGALPLSDDQLFNAIDNVAIRHLDLKAARDALDAALARVEQLAMRDEIEVAIDHLCAVLNVAYFNAGLAFGVTLADLKSL